MTIDMFGAAYTFKNNKKDKFKTKLGCFCTIFCFLALCFFSFIFGLDFYNKTNPEVSANDYEHDNFQSIPVSAFNYMIRIHDQIGTSSPLSPYKPHGYYEESIRNDKGGYDVFCATKGVISKCSETNAVNNPALKSLILSEWYCIDVEKIKEYCNSVTNQSNYEPHIGGFIGDERVGYINIGVFNTLFGTGGKIIETSTINEMNSNKIRGIDLGIPKFYFDANKTKGALITKMEIDRIPLDIETNRFEYRFLKQVSLIDDIGWLTEKLDKSHSIVVEKIQQSLIKNNLTQEGSVRIFSTAIWMKRSQLDFKRRFMKLQDVVTQVLAFFKGIFSICMYFVVSYALFKLTDEMIDGYFEVNKNYKVNKPGANIHVQEADKVDTIVNNSSGKIKKSDVNQGFNEKIWFLAFSFSGWYRQSVEQKSRIEFFKQARDFIDGRLDVMNILMLTDKFEKLVEMALSEEQQIELQSKHSVNKLNQ